jgi:hypothetical protein
VLPQLKQYDGIFFDTYGAPPKWPPWLCCRPICWPNTSLARPSKPPLCSTPPSHTHPIIIPPSAPVAATPRARPLGASSAAAPRPPPRAPQARATPPLAAGEYYEELREFQGKLPKLLRPTGVYSFFNGLASDNIFFHTVYSQ